MARSIAQTPTPVAEPDTNADANADAKQERLYFLDWLRIAAFALLVFYHVGMYYVSWEFHIKSPLASTTLEPIMTLSSPWRMSLLFVVSGAATSLMLMRSKAPGFMRQRSRRLLWPLLLGVLLLIPPQSYFEVVQQYGYAGGFIDFLALYFTAYSGFCKANHCLILPTWNHLWFLPYLWLYTLLFWWLATRAPLALGRAVALLPGILRGPRLLYLPLLVLALERWFLWPRFGSTHALVDDLYNHSVYVLMFLFGAMAVRRPELFLRMTAMRWWALLVAVAGWAVIVTLGRWRDAALFSGLQPGVVYGLAWAGLQWCAIVAAIGFAQRHWNKDHAWRAPLTEAVFPVYLVHQTFILCGAMALLPLHWPVAVEGPALIVGTFVASMVVWALARRVDALRPWLGMPLR